MELLPELAHRYPVVINAGISLNIRHGHRDTGWAKTGQRLDELLERCALDVRVGTPPRHERTRSGGGRGLQKLTP
jgi:hypothetical protein